MEKYDFLLELEKRGIYDAKQKRKNISIMNAFDLIRLRRMIKSNNLPETIPERDLILNVFQHGHVAWFPYEGKIHALMGYRGGELNEHLVPSQYSVANKALDLTKVFDIDKDCVVMPCNSLYLPLTPILEKYNSQLAENELTMNVVDILSRSSLVLKADGENEMASAQAYIDGLAKGELSVIKSDKLMGTDGVEAQAGATASASILTNLIEYEQYLKASKYNEFGLNANWNAKRESISGSESLLNEDTLNPLVDDILKCLNDAAEKINKMFPEYLPNGPISFEFDSSWKNNEIEIKEAQEAINNENSQTEGDENEENNSEEN